ncbi:MAG: hypothetical protein AB1554_00215 [Chloroflexota bacterium]
MKKLSLFIGPVLFLIAEIVLPGGSADPATRVEIIRNNSAAWDLGHQIIALAFVFLFFLVFDVYNKVKNGNGWMAGLGAFLSVFALAGDYGIGILQLLASDLVRSMPADFGLSALGVMAASSNLLLLAFLPTLGFLFGFGFLGFALYRNNRAVLPAALFVLSGLLISAGGMIQSKIVFIVGALALVGFAYFYSKTE